MPTVTCILVNWNNWQDTDACLTSLATQTHPLEILIVDNASTNDSVAQLRQRHPRATLLEAPANLGFPRACNLAARHPLAASAEFLWFLNNDTLVPPDTLTQLLAPQTDLTGAVLRYHHAPERIQAWGGGTVNPWTGYSRHFTAPHPFGPHTYLTFASALVRRTLFDRLEGLYEGAFMYYEDSDFCLRAHAAGATFAVAPGTAILHKEGGSQRGPRGPLDRILTLAGMLFTRRHCPIPWLGPLLFLTSRLAKRLLTLRLSELPPILQGARDFYQTRP